MAQGRPGLDPRLERGDAGLWHVDEPAWPEAHEDLPRFPGDPEPRGE